MFLWDKEIEPLHKEPVHLGACLLESLALPNAATKINVLPLIL